MNFVKNKTISLKTFNIRPVLTLAETPIFKNVKTLELNISGVLGCPRGPYVPFERSAILL